MTAPNTRPRVSRRAFLSLSALALAGCRSSSTPDGFDCDVCIVGSGFAGIYLAQRLVQHGLRVFVVEAGERLEPTAPADGATSLFPTTSTGSYAFSIDATRTIAVGGTSRKWNGVVSRLLPSDLRVQSARGLDADWPIDYATLEPYYCQAEQAMGVVGGPFIDGAEPARCPYPHEQQTYTSPADALGVPDRFFPLAFGLVNASPIAVDGEPLARLLASGRATLLDRHPVTALHVDAAGTVVSVEARRPDGTPRRIRARHTVVAAGVVETSRLLLLSRELIGGSFGGPRLGVGFNAHPRYRAQVRPRAGLPRFDRIHRSYLGNPDAFMNRGAYMADVHLASAPPLVDMMLELEASADNRLTIDRSTRDAWGRPSIALEANWTPRDLATRDAALRTQDQLTEPLGRTSTPPALRWFHPAGTCAMGRSPESGVVDANLRVYGVNNLYVAGAAVFPTAGTTNPTLTIVALALRLGDHLAAEHRRATT